MKIKRCLNLNNLSSAIALFAFVIIPPFTAAICPEELMMPDDNRTVTLSALTIPHASNVNSFSLIAAKDGVLAVMAETVEANQALPETQTTISSTRIEVADGKTSSIFEVPQLLPVVPKWDVVGLPYEMNHCVIERAGGALNAIDLYHGERKQTVTTDYPMGSFSYPRFVKRTSNGAVSSISNSKDLVVFTPDNSGKYGAYEKLGEWDDVVLIKCTGGYALFGKRFVPGAARNNVMPGVLTRIMLDDNFQANGKPTKPLGDQSVFEFDADLVNNDRHFAVLATLDAKVVLAVNSKSDNEYEMIEILGIDDQSQASAPTIVTNDAKIYVGLIERAQSENARLLIGTAKQKSK